jgi:uncharacterized damage-inducible protein DinB
MMRTPDGHSWLELSRFLAPPVVADHRNAPVNALGNLRVMFTLEDIDDTLARLGKHGVEIGGETETLSMETQPEPTLVEFVRYNQWANQQLLTICMNLDKELLTASMPGAYGSILETFAHLLRAEAGFLKRIHGTGPQPTFKWEESPSLAQMATFAAQVAESFMDTIRRVPPTQNVHEEGNGWIFDYQARLIFMSLFYHGVAHRTSTAEVWRCLSWMSGGISRRTPTAFKPK